MSPFSMLPANSFTWLVSSILLQSTVVIFVASIASKCFSNSPARRHAMWLCVLVFVGFIPFQGIVFRSAASVVQRHEGIDGQRPVALDVGGDADIQADPDLHANEEPLMEGSSQSRSEVQVAYRSVPTFTDLSVNEAPMPGPSIAASPPVQRAPPGFQALKYELFNSTDTKGASGYVFAMGGSAAMPPHLSSLFELISDTESQRSRPELEFGQSASAICLSKREFTVDVEGISLRAKFDGLQKQQLKHVEQRIRDAEAQLEKLRTQRDALGL